MLKRSPIYSMNEQTELDKSIAEWIFQSHYWVEDRAGYFQCEWCGRVHTSGIITKNDDLCKSNPKIVEVTRV